MFEETVIKFSLRNSIQWIASSGDQILLKARIDKLTADFIQSFEIKHRREKGNAHALTVSKVLHGFDSASADRQFR
jgi:hypothetical protein